MNKKFLFPIFAGVFLVAMALFWKVEHPVEPKMAVTNFEECVQAGYPVMESFPRQCKDASGKIFVEAAGGEVCQNNTQCTAGQRCVAGKCK